MPGLKNDLPPQGEDTSNIAVDLPATNRLRLPEQMLAVALTIMALSLHWINYARAGGFWRDEANSIAIALIPDMAKFWSALQFDSFPVAHYLAIRGWALMFGAGDSSLRSLGLTIGIMLIAAVWLNAIKLGVRVPLVSLLLIGLNPVMIRSLDALRANGLAGVTTILAFTAVWLALRQTDFRHLAIATITLVLCAQTLFQSAIFILAIGIAAMATGFLRGGVRQALLISVPFALAALSLVPYIGHLQKMGEWAPVAMTPAETKLLLPGLLKVIKLPVSGMVWLWTALGAVALCGLLQVAIKRGTTADSSDGKSLDRAIYCGITMAATVTLYMLFLARGIGFSPQPWHYVPFLVLVVISAEPLIGDCLENGRWRLILLLLVAGTAAVTVHQSARQLQERVTSMDLVAAAIAREARPVDLVVLTPWYNGVSFNRYYRGNAPWISFPSLKENSFHRYDLLKERMMHPETLADDMAIIMATLQQGGKVWVVGSVFAMQPGTVITPLPPAPLPASGWSSAPYLGNWNSYLLAALATRSSKGEYLSINTPGKTSPLEDPSIMVFQGWKD